MDDDSPLESKSDRDEYGRFLPGSGRHSEFTQEVADIVCDRMGNGESLSSICRDESMPCLSTVLKWARDIPAFSQQYELARENLQAHWAEQILEITDTPQIGQTVKTTENGVETTEADMLGHRRLQVDTRKWLLSKLAPKKYGDRIHQVVSDPDGNPLEVAIRAAKDLSTASDPNAASTLYSQLVTAGTEPKS